MPTTLTSLDEAINPRVPGELLLELTPLGRAALPALGVAPATADGGNVAGMGGPQGPPPVLLRAAFDDLGVRDLQLLKELGGDTTGPPLGGGGAWAPGPTSAPHRVRFDPARAEVAEAVRRFEDLPEYVRRVSPNFIRLTCADPAHPSEADQWALRRIRWTEAHDFIRDHNVALEEVVVAVLDTGVDRTHADLQHVCLPGRDVVNLGASDIPPDGWRWEGDTDTEDDEPTDDVGHGTAMAGVIGARADGQGIVGVAPCHLLPVRVLGRLVRSADGAVKGYGTSADIATGIRWAVSHGAHVINMSFGLPEVSFVERDAADKAIQRGCVLVAAAGNDGPHTDPYFPAALRDVIAVSAIDQDASFAAFSQRGWHIELCAPGVAIKSTSAGGGYTTDSGTSFSAAYVSGVAALLKAIDPGLRPADARAVLRATAANPGHLALPDETYGHGIVDARAAVEKLGSNG